MKTIAYCSPFVPPEWIAAHRLRPSWLRLRPSEHQPLASAGRGICPYAAALVDTVCFGLETPQSPLPLGDVAAVVLTTACDQMRFATALIEQRGAVPVFLLNVPSTWATPHVRDLYRDELARLGRFLVRLGGEPPSAAKLAEVMIEYDTARAAIRRGTVPFRAPCGPMQRGTVPFSSDENWDSPQVAPPFGAAPAAPTAAVPLALLGGPLLDDDYEMFDLVERAGGRIVLDATEGGQRTLPAEFRRERLREDPFEELADAYFHAIPDVFRRPNDRLYQWLARQIAACQARGIVLRRYVWCDLWHAEAERLRRWSPVPVLDLDIHGDDHDAPARTQGRVEAFLETLR